MNNLIQTICGNRIPESQITLVSEYDDNHYRVTCSAGCFVVEKKYIDKPTRKKAITK